MPQAGLCAAQLRLRPKHLSEVICLQIYESIRAKRELTDKQCHPLGLNSSCAQRSAGWDLVLSIARDHGTLQNILWRVTYCGAVLRTCLFNLADWDSGCASHASLAFTTCGVIYILAHVVISSLFCSLGIPPLVSTEKRSILSFYSCLLVGSEP